MKFSLNLPQTFFLLLLTCSFKSCSCGLFEILTNALLSEDGRLNFIQLATKYGFPNVEKKDVITEDGYILTLYHIPGDPQKAVLLAHGNTASAYCWIIRGYSSLAITLAQKGYDVWAINFRGTTESRRHVYIDEREQKAQFYNYSFYEQGTFDLSATIDLILNETKQEKLLAIGHSVGTTNFYVLGSERPEYNDKIKAVISLAPIRFLQHVRGIGAFANAYNLLGFLTGSSEEASRQILGAGLFNATCLGPLAYSVCVRGLIFPLFGPDPQGFEPEFVKTFFGHYPAGSSRKMFSHLGQVVERDKFAKYDYGTRGNLVEYGSAEPPEFDLSKVSMKTALFVGREDYLASEADAQRLRIALPNVVHYQVMPYVQFNHFDFVWGRFMPTNLYPYLLPIVEKYIV